VKGAHGVVLVAVVALVAGAGASARATATADVSVKWAAPVEPSKPLVGQIFRLQAGIVNGGPDVGNVRVNVQMPTGVSRVGGGLECTQEGQVLHCDEIKAPVGDDGSGTLTLKAAAPGSYPITVFLDHLDATDPNLADNSDSVTVDVVAIRVAAGALAIKPAHPVAGSPFLVSFPVTGAAIASATCTSTLGRATGKVVGGRATCSIVTPKSARGRVIHGKVIARTETETFARAFSFRLR
jgi:hypothetical protein